jgi:hypothetical protein
LVNITKKSLEVVVEIISRVHEHGVKDKAIEEDEDLEEDSHDERERKAKILVKVVKLILLLLFPIGKLENGQDLKEGTNGRIFLAEEYDDTHELQKEIPILEFFLK